MIDKPEKFLFNLNDFNEQEAVKTEEEAEPSFSEDDLNAAREESFKLGVQDATQKIRGEHEERTVQTLETLTRQLNAILDAETTRTHEKNLDTARLTLSIVKKLMPHFSKKYAEEEIIALIRQSMNDRNEEPRLVVTVNDMMLSPLRDKIDAITSAQGYQGQVVIIADENIKPNDCRVEWADGGIEKDFDRLYGAIEQAFHTVLQRLDMPVEPAGGSPENTQAEDL